MGPFWLTDRQLDKIQNPGLSKEDFGRAKQRERERRRRKKAKKKAEISRKEESVDEIYD